MDFNLGAIRFTASGFAATCLTNAMVYLFKNLINAISDPKAFVVIKAKVENVKKNAVDAKIVRTAFHITEIREQTINT